MKIKQNHSLNILLADDDVDDRIFFEKALKEIPIATTLKIFTDGERLINYLTENYDHLPDVLFLDLSMPRKTGYECLHDIKEDKKLKNMPVFIFSKSFPQGVEFEQSLTKTLFTMGAHNYIRKSSNLEQLKQSILQALSNL